MRRAAFAKGPVRLAAMAASAALALAALLAAQTAVPPLFLPAGEGAPIALDPQWTLPESGAAVVRARAVAIDLAALDPERPIARIRLNLFPDTAADFVRTRPRGSEPRPSEWHGRSAARAGDTAVFSVTAGRVNGNIVLDGRFYQVRHIADDLHVVREIVAQRPSTAPDFVEPPSRPPPGAVAPAEKQKGGRPRAEAAGDPVVDVLVVYTAAARQRMGGSQQIQDRIRLAVAEANAASVNSEAAIEFRLAGMAEVAPSGSEAASVAFLEQVTFYEPEIAALRDRFGADVVSVWVHSGTASGVIGIAWLDPAPDFPFAPYAYGIVETAFALGPNYTFAHEAGHNLGLAHNRENAGGPGAYSYAYGYRNPSAPGGGFFTIMSYSSNCPGCSAPNHWSNPNVVINGAPSGVPVGQAAEAHNALALTNIAPIAAGWRSAVDPPANGSPVAADQVVEVQHNTPRSITLSAADPDNDPLRYVIVSGPAQGSLTGSGANRTYTPNPGYAGPDLFRFEAIDPYGGFGAGTVAISVLGPGGAPPPTGIPPGSPLVDIPFTSFASGRALDVSGNGHHLNLGLSAAPEAADPTLLAKGVLFNYAERDVLSFDGPSVGGVDFFATPDSRFSFAFAVKRGPYWPPSNQYPIDAGHLNLRLYDRDANARVLGMIRGRGVAFGAFDDTRTAIVVARWDGQALSLSVNGAPPVAQTRGSGSQQFAPLLFGRDLSTGSEYYHLLIWNQALSDAQLPLAFEYLCGALGAASLSRPANCPTQPPPPPPNQPPTAHPQTLSTDYGAPLGITLTGADPDGDPLTFSIVSGPSQGALSGAPPSIVYTPATGFSGPDSFTFAVSDGRGGSSQATVSITVGPPPAGGGGAPFAPLVDIPFTSFASGRALDVSGNGHHLNLGLSAAPEAADPTPLAKGVLFDYAERDVLSFDGPSVGGVDFFATPDSRFSFAFAVKRGPYWPPGNQYPIDAGHLNLRLYDRNANARVLGVIRGRGVTFGNFDETRTAIVVASWDGQTLSLSVNGGAPVAHTRGNGSQQFAPLLFGRDLSTGSEYYHLLIWNQALDGAESSQAFEYLCGQLAAAALSRPVSCPGGP